MSDIPKWKEDFPIEWDADNYVTRREFTKFLVMISGATVAGNGFFVLQRLRKQREPYSKVRIAAVADVGAGGVQLFRYPTENDPALLIRLSDGRFVAYTQRCTHLSCPVQFVAGQNRLECPCHNGAFDAATGEVLEGPPPRGLPRITLAVEDGSIFATGVQGS